MYKLNDGQIIPEIGFGTYQLNGNKGAQSIVSAINNGYRMIDTAYNYENEGAVGEAIGRTSIPRTELTVTSKLPGRYYKQDKAIEAIQESLYRAHLDYFDLYLLHWPNPKRDMYVEAWDALIQAKKFGLVKSIGVCNFLPEHLDRLERETGVVPAINQIELHPYFNQEDMRSYDVEHGIVTMDWSPLGRASSVLKDPVLMKLAEKYGKSVGQIILRWEHQIDTLPIPKSSNPSRQMDNIDIFNFNISDDDINKINSLTKVDGRVKNQDPAEYEEF
ncbi:aldo/keto reductase [Companilactobacillus allii]|uniref:2,5-diketo-D-gluconic acid reductase n=1 Tax=Companilactobacillus allii TaxID=1847728 RepID=A0A1P8Q5L8_9LACO|nr:aldo/keto reductase [Companilactobacillus allii]APX73150.1 2,5-diketo-D-gluconic acid reductase [Companilactobacillus allii]USQ67955.1 aldo/keto reductase [Companilactobacillus allii]